MRPTLRNFLAKHRVIPHSTTGIAPCKLLLKRHLRAKLDLLQPTSIDVHKGKLTWMHRSQLPSQKGNRCRLEAIDMAKVGTRRNAW